MKRLLTITKMLVPFILVAGFGSCKSKTTEPQRFPVDATVKVAIYQTDAIDTACNLVYPSLIEDTVHISELLKFHDNDSCITVPFKFSDTSKYARITEDNIGRRIAIAINGQVLTMPVVKSKITDGSCFVLLPPARISSLFEEAD